MKRFDLTFPTPAENLACDEALLDAAEAGEGGEVLRFWEPREHFVVVGYANKVAAEVNVTACKTRKIPILRRCSGGGTVLQGPGCLNYALVLRITENGPLRNIASANCFIMERNRTAMESALRNSDFPSPGHAHGITLSPSDGERDGVRGVAPSVQVRGHTDLVNNGHKFSGNSQRRRRHFLLFHGAFLLDFDLALVSQLLPTPSKQPAYRRNRTHTEFLTNLNLPADKVKSVLQKAWNATSPLKDPPLGNIAALACEKYAMQEWNFKC